MERFTGISLIRQFPILGHLTTFRLKRILLLVAFCLVPSLGQSSPRIYLSATTGSGAYKDVELYGSTVYCAASGTGIDIIDASNISEPSLLTHAESWGDVQFLARDGNILFAACDMNPAGPYIAGITAFDLTNAFHPEEKARALIPAMQGESGNITGLCVSNGYVFCTYHLLYNTDGMQIFKYNRTAGTLELIKKVDLWGFAYGIDISGSLAYIANSSRGLQIWDISDPTQPSQISETLPVIHSVAVDSDNNLLYGAYAGDLTVYNIEDPADPTIVGTGSFTGQIRSLHLADSNTLMISTDTGLKIMDVSDPTQPKPNSQFSHNNYNSQLSNGVHGVVTSGDDAYVASGSNGLDILNIHTEESEMSVANLDVSIVPRQIYCLDNYVISVLSGEGIAVFEMEESGSLSKVAHIDNNISTTCSILSGNYLYIVTQSQGLLVVDLTNPLSPEIVATYSDPGYSQQQTSLAVINDVLYMGYGNTVKAISVSDPKHPYSLISSTFGWSVVGLATDGTNLFATNSNSFHFLKPKDNSSLIQDMAQLSLTFGAGGSMAFEDGYAYVNSGSSSIHIIDIHNPANPVYVSRIGVHSYAGKLAILNHHLIAAEQGYGVYLFDVSNPASPRALGAATLPGGATDVAFANETQAFSCGYSSGISMLSLGEGGYIPHIDWSTEWSSYLIADNTSDTDIEMRYQLFGDDLVNNIVTVPAQKSMKFDLDKDTCGTIQCDRSGLLLKESFVNNRQQGIAEFPVTGEAYPELEFVLPHYLSDQMTWMGIALFNPDVKVADVIMKAYDENGTLLDTQQTTIPETQRIVGYVSTFFPSLTYQQVSRIEVQSNNSLCGLNISGHENEKLLFTSASRNRSNSVLVIPHIANQWDYWNNKLVVDNVGTDTVQAIVYLYGNGQQLTSTQGNVQAGHTWVLDLNQFKDLDPQCGYMTLYPDNAIVRQSFEYIDTGGTAEFALSRTFSNQVVLDFPSYASDELSWMGFALMNVGDEATTADLVAYRDGVEVARTTLEIKGNDRVAKLLSDVFPDASAAGIDRIVASASQPLAGINISGSGQDRYLFTPAFPK